MPWKTLITYISGSVDEEMLQRNEYLVAENRILRTHTEARLRLTNPERVTLAKLGKKLGIRALEDICSVALRELAITMAGLGLRTGEALHLEWFDIDFDRRVAKVRNKPNTPTRFGMGWKPKWDKERVVPMPSIVADVLRGLPRHVVTGKLPDGAYQTGLIRVAAQGQDT